MGTSDVPIFYWSQPVDLKRLHIKEFVLLHTMRAQLFILLVVLLSSCASSRFVEPLDKNQLAVGVELGGPALGFGGAVIPTPLSSISAGYGIDTNVTVYGCLLYTSDAADD